MALMTLTCSGLDVLGIPGDRGCFEQQGQGVKGSRIQLSLGKRQGPSLPRSSTQPSARRREARKLQAEDQAVGSDLQAVVIAVAT